MGRLLAIARKTKSHAPMDALETAQVTRQAGVEGDYRGAAKGHEERQVTVLSREVWQLVCAELAAELPWHLRRANLLVEGVELPRQGRGAADHWRPGAGSDHGDRALLAHG